MGKAKKRITQALLVFFNFSMSDVLQIKEYFKPQYLKHLIVMAIAK
jgi:hypothetical protein